VKNTTNITTCGEKHHMCFSQWQRILQSTKSIQDVASQMASSNEPLLRKLEKEIASQDVDVLALSVYSPH